MIDDKQRPILETSTPVGCATGRPSMEPARNTRGTAMFLADAIREIAHVELSEGLRVLDFGCGDGALVEQFRDMGWRAAGCDFAVKVRDSSADLRAIETDPYRLPFPDGSFDIVVSMSVFEHAQNKEECFVEIARVLRPGGYALHLFPAKWHLPTETHIHVPFASWLWPRCPRWWLGLWALAGVRNKFQRGKPWREVMELNIRYCRDGLSYWRTGQYNAASARVFAETLWPMRFYVAHAPGGVARLGRRLHAPGIVGLVGREVREAFLVQRTR